MKKCALALHHVKIPLQFLIGALADKKPYMNRALHKDPKIYPRAEIPAKGSLIRGVHYLELQRPT